MEKISIIVPVYKVEKYLDKCVESLVNQTYGNLEIILVEDGSPDNCPKMCDEWERKDSRIKVIHKQNGGLSDARNVGIEIASGDYLMFVDSDDYVDVAICQKLIETLKTNNADVVMCKALKVYEDKEAAQCSYDKSIQVYRDNEVLNELYKREIEYFMTAWAKLYKKEIFEKIRYPKGKLHEDEFVIHEIIAKTKSFAVIDEPLYFYLQRGSSIMGTRGEKSIQHAMEAFKQRFEFLQLHFPNNKQQNVESYLSFIRSFYPTISKKHKQVRLNLINEFKEKYSTLTSHTNKDKLFRWCRPVYMLLLQAKKMLSK